jgi:hypothetical protein
MHGRIGDRSRIGHADAIKTQRARFADQLLFEINGSELDWCVQKSRST